MSHVQIRQAHPGVYQCIVDGRDMTRDILAGTLSVEFPQDSEFDVARVTITLAADTLDIDMPDAILEALRDTEDQVADGPVLPRRVGERPTP